MRPKTPPKSASGSGCWETDLNIAIYGALFNNDLENKNDVFYTWRKVVHLNVLKKLTEIVHTQDFAYPGLSKKMLR